VNKVIEHQTKVRLVMTISLGTVGLIFILDCSPGNHQHNRQPTRDGSDLDFEGDHQENGRLQAMTFTVWMRSLCIEKGRIFWKQHGVW